MNLKIFSLWPLHDDGSSSYTPILRLKPKNFLGVLDFEEHLFHDKIMDQSSLVYFLLSMSTLKNSSDIYVFRHIITKIIEQIFLTPFTTWLCFYTILKRACLFKN